MFRPSDLYGLIHERFRSPKFQRDGISRGFLIDSLNADFHGQPGRPPLWPLIAPSWFGHAFYIFLMRQFIRTVPLELDDAARIDGCSTFRIYWNIILPLSRPALGTVAIFSFQGKWNQFFEPLIYIDTKEKLPLAVGVRMFHGALLVPGGTTSYNISWSHLLAATVLMVLPIVVVFFSAQRAFIQGIVVSGVKG